MKVILLTDVAKLGKKDEIVEVNDGYAKNFLIRNKLAVQLSQGTKASLNNRQAIKSQNELELTKQAEQLKKQIEQELFIFELKCHENKVFGHVSLKELLITVNKKFPTINKFMFIDKVHEWSLGKHDIKVQLYKNVIALIKIDVVPNNC